MRHSAPLILLAVGLVTGAAAAQSPVQGPDCARAYTDMLGTIARRKPHLSATAEVELERIAVRIYDACVTGHLERPGELFDKLARHRE